MQNTMQVQTQSAGKADTKGLALGIAVGLVAASIGALYTVYARWGITRGLSSPDLTALRFGVAGIATLPLLLHAMAKRREILLQKWGICLAVSLLAGTRRNCLRFPIAGFFTREVGHPIQGTPCKSERRRYEPKLNV